MDELVIFDAFHVQRHLEPKAFKGCWWPDENLRMNLRVCSSLLLAGLGCDEL